MLIYMYFWTYVTYTPAHSCLTAIFQAYHDKPKVSIEISGNSWIS